MEFNVHSKIIKVTTVHYKVVETEDGIFRVWPDGDIEFYDPDLDYIWCDEDRYDPDFVDELRNLYEGVKMNVEQIAKVAHEVNRALCQAFGDDTQMPWEEAPEWQRSSAINNVEFHIINPSAGPEHSHNSWMTDKLNSGWKWGPIKDAEKKEHPSICAYRQLPPHEKAKDYLFCAVVNALKDE
jgi:hypothetical protein